jgi:hypothetical protein
MPSSTARHTSSSTRGLADRRTVAGTEDRHIDRGQIRAQAKEPDRVAPPASRVQRDIRGDLGDQLRVD